MRCEGAPRSEPTGWEVVPVGAKIAVNLPEPLLATLDRLARCMSGVSSEQFD